MGDFRKFAPRLFSLALLPLTVWGSVSFAQTPASPPAARAPASPPAAKPAGESTPAIEAGVLDELNRMGAYLRTLNMFTLNVTGSRDEVLLNGQKIQFEGKLTYKYRRPNGLFLSHDTDRVQRKFYFNGKNFTLYAPRMHYYATGPAPATVKDLASDLESKYDIELPLADLFMWGTDETSTAAIKNAIDVGPAHINGVACEQFAFRQEGVDWQIWVEHGAKPLPRKLVIVTTDDDAKPQYEAELNWDTTTAVPESAFTFTPPKDAHRITFATADGSADAAKEKGHDN